MHRFDFIANHSNPKNTHNMKTRIILLTLALSVCSIWAADITGVWKAQFDAQRGLQKYTFTLQHDGTQVTGNASAEVNGAKRESELKEGKIEGDTVSFVEPLNIQGNDRSEERRVGKECR